MQASHKSILTRAVFTVAISFYSLCGVAEGIREDFLEGLDVQESVWEFSLKPFPHLSKYGNVTYGNQFIIKLNKECAGAMSAYFASYKKEELLESEGKTLPVEFSISSVGKKEVIQSESMVMWADNVVMGGLEMAFAISMLELISINDIAQLKYLAEYQQVNLSLTAENDEIFDIPRERWDIKGLVPAVNKATAWCAAQNKGDAKHEAKNVSYYVSL